MIGKQGRAGWRDLSPEEWDRSRERAALEDVSIALSMDVNEVNDRYVRWLEGPVRMKVRLHRLNCEIPRDHPTRECPDPMAAKPTLTIPDDPEVIALVLCRDHLDCRDHIGGHDAFIWQGRRLLANLRSLSNNEGIG